MGESSDEEDWLDCFPQQVEQQPHNHRELSQEGEGQEEHPEQEDRGVQHRHPDQEELYDSIAQRKPKRKTKTIERLGVRQEGKVTSPSRSQRKKRQGEARRRAKEVWVFEP